MIAPCHLARSESTAHRAKKQQHHQIANRVAQPSGAATPRNSDAHKRIAVPKALCVLWEHPTKPQKRQSLPFYPLATQGFRNVWNVPRVVIAPPPRTFRKYCAQSEKTATSPSCKQITQPSGAATPRDSDAHKRIAVPKALCVLCEHTRSRPKSGKIRRSGTRPGDVRERAERSEGSDTTPIRNAPCFAVCALVCDSLSEAECVPTFTCESERGAFVREAEKCDEKRFGTEL